MSDIHPLREIDCEICDTPRAQAQAAIAWLKQYPRALVYVIGYRREQIGKALLELAGPGMYATTVDAGRVVVTTAKEFRIK